MGDLKIVYETISRKKAYLTKALKEIDLNNKLLAKVVNRIYDAFNDGNKIMVFGNGGSAAQAQHFTAEFIGIMGLPAMTLSTDTSNMTAIANDYGYEKVFSKQLSALGKGGDVAIGISTSGNSKNVVEGLKQAQKMGITTIGLMGKSTCKMYKFCDIPITIAVDNQQTMQEVHEVILHLIFESLQELERVSRS